MLGATNATKNSDKSKYIYSVPGVTFVGAGSWSFGNDFARRVVSFCVDNGSSSPTDNRKNNFLVLGEGPTDDTNGSVSTAEKSFSVKCS